MANTSDNGLGTLIVIAAIAFFVGRASVSDSKPTTPTTQQFLEAPAADETSAPTAESMYSAAASIEASSVYYRNCSAARAAGAAPVSEGEPGYAPHLDRDGDGVGCE